MATYDQSVTRSSGSDPLVKQPLKGQKMATPDAGTMRKLQAQGKAIPNANGDPSFPVRNAADLDKAIKAVGRVKPDTDAARAKVRRYLIDRAKALGLSSQIPDTWNSDGSLKDDSSGDSSDDSDSSNDSGSDDSSQGDSSDDGDLQAAIKKLVAKGMTPAAARIFAVKAAAKKSAS